MKLMIGILTMFLAAPAAMAEGPCKADRDTHCQGVEPGEGRIARCMKENEAKLSAECKTWRDSRKEHMKDVREACQDDAEKLCPDVKPGKGAMMKCLRSNKDKVSDACKAEFAEMKKARKGK